MKAAVLSLQFSLIDSPVKQYMFSPLPRAHAVWTRQHATYGLQAGHRTSLADVLLRMSEA